MDMALEIATAFNNGEVALLEAGTGSGLCYLVPAAMWAQQNQTKVVLRYVYDCLAGSAGHHIPIFNRPLDVRFALIKGRNNISAAEDLRNFI